LRKIKEKALFLHALQLKLDLSESGPVFPGKSVFVEKSGRKFGSLSVKSINYLITLVFLLFSFTSLSMISKILSEIIR